MDMDKEIVQAVKDLTTAEVQRIVRENYDVVSFTVKVLPGWVDKNFQIQTLKDQSTHSENDDLHQAVYVLKILNAKESKEVDFIDAQNTVMLHLKGKGFICCWPIYTTSGLHNTFYRLNDERFTPKGEKVCYLVRLMNYVHGRVLDTAGLDLTDDLLYQTGAFIASVNTYMQPCNEHIGLQSRPYSTWNLESVPRLRGALSAIKNHLEEDILGVILEVLDNFDQNVVPKYDVFQKGLIHGDCNPGNVLLVDSNVTAAGSAMQYTLGIIDFGEIANSFVIFELAVALTHFMMLCHKRNILSSVIKLREGFTAVIPLNTAELSALKYCVAARLVQSVVLSTCCAVKHGMTSEMRQSNFDSMSLLKIFNTISIL